MMKSVEDELSEIEDHWEVSYLDLTDSNHRYRVELKKEEVIVRLSIPEDYPGVPPEFEFGGKEIDEKMQQSTLRVAQQNLSANTGKPMIGLVLGNIWKHIKSGTMQKDTKISKNSPTQAIISPKRQEKKKTRYKLACNFGGVGSNQSFRDLPDVKIKSTIKKSLNDSTNSKESQKSQKIKTEPIARDKAPPMKTARDVINRLKWDDQLKHEEFVVGYVDRFEGIIEVPVFDLNWKDDIASTGPADTLAIPEHRVQYFKLNSQLVWEKSSRTDLIFGSTGSKTDIMKLIQRWKKQQKQNEDMVAQEFNAVEVNLDNSLQTNQEKDLSLVDIGSAEVSRKETADETPQVTACEKVDEILVEETAGLEELSQDQTEKTGEDTASSATTVEKSCNASRVDDELKIGVQGVIDEVLNDILYQLESIDINTNDVNPREFAGQKQRYDGGHSKSFSGGSKEGHSQRHRGRRGYHNQDRKRYGRGGGRKDGSGSHYDSRDQSQYDCPNPNFNIGIELDDSSNEKLSHAIRYATDTEKIQIRRIEDCYGSMSNLYIPSLSDASKLVTVLKSACKSWTQIYATVCKIDVEREDVTVLIHSKSLSALHKKISRSTELDARLYNFQYLPHIRIGTAPDARKKVLRFEEKVDLKIIGLNLFKIEETNFDIRELSAVKFDLQIPDEQDKRTDRKRNWKDSYGHGRGEGQDKRFRLQKGRGWETNISKRLSAILRHGAMGFKIDEEGFVEVKTLLAHQFFSKNSVEGEDITRIVANNAKKRFTLEGNPGNYKIRANQGHSVQVENLHLKEITNAEDFPKVVHGTNMKFWDSIKRSGLNRMRRNHIHMTTSEPRSDEELISGMRNSSNCFVYINLAKAMKDGIKFFLSDNGVILSEGVDGVLDRKYFSHAAGIRNGKRFDLLIKGDVPLSKDRLHETSSTEHSEEHSETKDPVTSHDE